MGEPYVKVPLSIITSDLKPQSKVLLAYMINFKNMNGKKPICKSARELGEAVKMPSTTVKRSLAELESRGLIEVQKGHTSSYIVRSNMDQSQSNMDRFSPNRTDPIHLYREFSSQVQHFRIEDFIRCPVPQTFAGPHV